METKMHEDIAQFMAQQTCANVCCIDEQQMPYCFTCFFVYDAAKHCLYFKSSSDTHHAQLLQKNGVCAGTILPDQLNTLMIQGIQFEGTVQKNTLFDVLPAMQYHTAYPIAMAVPGDMWTITLLKIKFTDNAKGFGNKQHWEREKGV
ncbi:PNPOx family protein [Edaphocola flava]|uniref:pyridoxamine 5'-phosphate oxidase family protein n=1 Tax=Edaphocola flava TaxID=2499629 RepID=UPI00100B5023|nr:pyridoxamine 5'-phosphate oxidase family protein [Edaphocola flava]